MQIDHAELNYPLACTQLETRRRLAVLLLVVGYGGSSLDSPAHNDISQYHIRNSDERQTCALAGFFNTTPASVWPGD